jgi:hypothetical protein
MTAVYRIKQDWQDSRSFLSTFCDFRSQLPKIWLPLPSLIDWIWQIENEKPRRSISAVSDIYLNVIRTKYQISHLVRIWFMLLLRWQRSPRNGRKLWMISFDWNFPAFRPLSNEPNRVLIDFGETIKIETVWLILTEFRSEMYDRISELSRHVEGPRQFFSKFGALGRRGHLQWCWNRRRNLRCYA